MILLGGIFSITIHSNSTESIIHNMTGMTEGEIKEGKHLGGFCKIIYSEYYLPICEKENKIPIECSQLYHKKVDTQIIYIYI